MTTEKSESLVALTEQFRETLSELESLQTELSEMSAWADDAEDQLTGLPADHQMVIGQRAAELQGQLRIISDPEELVAFGERIKEVFAEPLVQAALDGLTDVIDQANIGLPQDRHEELEERVRGRAPSDLQTDVEAYTEVLALTEDFSSDLLGKVSDKINSDPSRYLIGPNADLLPLAENLSRRRDAITALEEAFEDAGDWTPNGLEHLTEAEGLYLDYEKEVDIEAITAEIDEIDNFLSDLPMHWDLPAVVSSDVESRLQDTTLSEYQYELNKVAMKLSKVRSQVIPTLNSVDELLSRNDIPDSISGAYTSLSEAKSSFDDRSFESLTSFLGAATNVEESNEAFWEAVEEELHMLDGMANQLGAAEALADKEPPTLVDPLNEVNTATLINNPDAAFESIRQFRAWVNEALTDLADNLDGADISELFERLYSEGSVELESIDLATLRELQGTVPIVVSLQR